MSAPSSLLSGQLKGQNPYPLWLPCRDYYYYQRALLYRSSNDITACIVCQYLEYKNILNIFQILLLTIRVTFDRLRLGSNEKESYAILVYNTNYIS